MFEITVAPGAWAAIGRLIIFEVDGLYAIFFLGYVWGVTFAIIRVITALFLKNTLAVAANDEETAREDRKRKNQQDLSHLKAIFKKADTDQSGFVTLKEFTRVMKKPRVAHWLAAVGLEVSELEKLFALMDDGDDGQVSIEEFTDGAMRIRGDAKSSDLVHLTWECARMHKELKE